MFCLAKRFEGEMIVSDAVLPLFRGPPVIFKPFTTLLNIIHHSIYIKKHWKITATIVRLQILFIHLFITLQRVFLPLRPLKGPTIIRYKAIPAFRLLV